MISWGAGRVLIPTQKGKPTVHAICVGGPIDGRVCEMTITLRHKLMTGDIEMETTYRAEHYSVRMKTGVVRYHVMMPDVGDGPAERNKMCLETLLDALASVRALVTCSASETCPLDEVTPV